jgi:hypothetical protein
MIVAAVRNRPYGLLNWPMYTWTAGVVADLERDTDDGPVELNPYHFRPSHWSQMTARDFDLLLEYLRARYPDERITGSGVLYGNVTDIRIRVVDGYVVVQGIRRQLRLTRR